MSKSIRINTMAITPTCRENKGAESAFDDAVDRLESEYRELVELWDDRPKAERPTFKLTMTMERD